jgi:hypothetical protein
MTRPDPVDGKVSASYPADEEDRPGVPTSMSGERLRVDEPEEARIPFRARMTPACRRPRR